MPRPYAHKTGVFFLYVRVPSDLAPKMRATRISLPLEERLVTLTVTDKVFLSLRTKDPTLARRRFVEAYGALTRQFEALRSGPKPMTHKQLVALAGDVYRARAARFENDPTFGPDVLLKDCAIEEAAFRAWKFGAGDGLGEISDEHARFYAAIQRPSGPQLLAFQTQEDVVLETCTVTYDEALEYLFETDINAICARRGIVIDAETRTKLLREIAQAVRLVGGKLVRNMSGDYSDDPNVARFPVFEPSAPAEAPLSTKNSATISKLFEAWKAYYGDRRAASTLRHYTPSIESLIEHLGTVDLRLVAEDDIWSWAEKRRDPVSMAS